MEAFSKIFDVVDKNRTDLGNLTA